MLDTSRASARPTLVPTGRMLAAMASGLGARLDTATLRALMHDYGREFARGMRLPDHSEVSAIEASMQAVWDALEWGRVDIVAADGALQLVHRDAPLRAALGADALAWTSGFLEGVYQQWFVQLGADAPLHVREVASTDDAILNFRFGA